MTTKSVQSAEFYELADSACEGTLSDDDFEKLEQLLKNNVEAQRYYLKHVSLDRLLRWEFARELPETTQEPPAIGPIYATTSGALGYFSTGWPVAYLVATVVILLGLWVGSVVHISQPTQIVLPSPGHERGAGVRAKRPLSLPASPAWSIAYGRGQTSGFRVQKTTISNQQSEIRNPWSPSATASLSVPVSWKSPTTPARESFSKVQ